MRKGCHVQLDGSAPENRSSQERSRAPHGYDRALFFGELTIVTRHLTIRGRVQGVWYRAWAVRHARELALAGWVRNCRDGTVEAVVQGDAADVERFIALAREGSPGSRVDLIDAREAEPIPSAGFE
jgi:acylphosphatase